MVRGRRENGAAVCLGEVRVVQVPRVYGSVGQEIGNIIIIILIYQRMATIGHFAVPESDGSIVAMSGVFAAFFIGTESTV
jgi:hypothetical protein